MFKMEFETSGTAFGSEYDPEYIQTVDKVKEINRIFQELSIKVAGGYTSGSIMDINGNKIGEWSLN